ncbi:helix-turn-helix domain-containing protein [Polymorphospora sp. NPDC050346]|uniref:TetR/AcrR family transcriptional regulator n=1 Tax=Polymorphospora sp. NPDC050346 TaxID=3155780 RepID=UPI0033CCA11A
MARPRKITDDRLLAAAATVIGRHGPAFTLADIAAEARISAGTLIHRFGSKHGLLTAMLAASIDAARQPATTSPDDGDPVATIRHALVDRYTAIDDPTTAPNHLAQLATELADEHLRTGLADLHSAVEATVATLVRAAVEAGTLPGAPAAAVAARILTATADGAAIHWSSRPDGRLRDRLHTDLDAILAGWRHPTHT